MREPGASGVVISTFGVQPACCCRMAERHRGGILNVASIAGYLPDPGQAVYHATEWFVRSFSLALSEEDPRHRGPGHRLVSWTRRHRVPCGRRLRLRPTAPQPADAGAVGRPGSRCRVAGPGRRPGRGRPRPGHPARPARAAVRSVAPGRSNGRDLRHVARLQVTHAPRQWLLAFLDAVELRRSRAGMRTAYRRGSGLL